VSTDASRQALLALGTAGPPVTAVGITGHQEIPDVIIPFVRTGIEAILKDLENGWIGVSCLAAGADQLFARAVVQAKGELHVVIPCAGYERTFLQARDLMAFRDLVRSATSVTRLDYQQPSEDAFLDAGRTVVQMSQVLVAVWDGKEARGRGGTADIVAYARDRGLAVKIVWPDMAQR
jgi:hypothetical protein